MNKISFHFEEIYLYMRVFFTKKKKHYVIVVQNTYAELCNFCIYPQTLINEWSYLSKLNPKSNLVLQHVKQILVINIAIFRHFYLITTQL